jgi:hypothetical protein
MKFDLPDRGTRWFVFHDPANKARIVRIVDVIGNGWIKTAPLIDGNREYWTLIEFTENFRPL